LETGRIAVAFSICRSEAKNEDEDAGILFYYKTTLHLELERQRFRNFCKLPFRDFLVLILFFTTKRKAV
jgi:hypothetical protein